MTQQTEPTPEEIMASDSPVSFLRMTPEQRAEAKAKNPPQIHGLHWAKAYFDWSWKGCGFGQLSFHYDRDTGELTVQDEFMGRDNARKLMYAMVDHIVDNAKFESDKE